jgi:hypothetical protein
VVGGDLQDLGGVGQSMHLVEDDRLAPEASEDGLRIFHLASDPWQLAIEVFRAGDGAAEEGLADAANAHEPDHRSASPRAIEEGEPVAPPNHSHTE